MKTLDLKRGIQGEYIGSASLIDEVVNNDDFGPSLQLDFEEVGQLAYVEQDGERQYQRTMQLLDAVCARASGATNVEWDFSNGGVVGALTEVGANSVRWNSEAGLFEDVASTNEIRNPRAEGAVVGTPGTVPTNWQVSGLGTASQEVVGSGYEGGWPYVDVRFSGTPSGNITVLFESNAQVSAATGQTWTLAGGVKIASGSLSNLSGVSLDLVERTGAGGFVTTQTGATETPLTTHARFFSTATLSGGGTVSAVVPGLKVIWDGSGAIDITLRIYAPQLEQASAPTSPILPPIGSPAASTRAAETVTALASVTRASRKSNAGAWDFTNGGTVGVYREFRPNQPAITKRGLLVEEASTNEIRNPRGEGAVAGTPGTAPAFWTITPAGGVSRAIEGSGYENGWPYVDVRFFGTASAPSIVAFEANGVVPASPGEPWTVSFGVRIVGGTAANVSQLNSNLVETEVPVSYLRETNGSGVVPTNTHQRVFNSTVTGADTGAVTPRLRLVSAGAIDITLRIYVPQLEQKAYPTSPILPPAGTLAASTRAADDVEVGNGAWASTAGTLYVEGVANSFDAAQTLVSYGASNDDRADITVIGSGSFQARYRSNATTDDTLLSSSKSVGESLRAAITFDASSGASSIKGETQSTFTPTDALPSTSSIAFGALFAGASTLGSSYIKQVRYTPRRAPNAELETLVGN